MNDDRPRGGGGGYLNGLLTGVLVGAAAVFLTSTKRGRILSKQVRKQGKKSFKELEQLVTEIEAKGEELAEKAQVAKDQLAEKVEDIKELNYIQQLQEKGRVVAGKFFQRNGKTLG